ncbi:macro domain-containing protein [Tahibacter caeni]|uniref:macro domain-containing protein n=1 Tax=Tahibacter caeni TaxID=1453545 RepID=UPI0021494F6C|nr:macro domain-containing protein [Tahibacter caeni]
MLATVVDGDLLDQPVDVLVNAWNRNVIPWWLLLPQGVSGAIKRRAGLAPFVELGRAGPLALGDAVLTGSGRLPVCGIIHVAGIDLLWRASAESIRCSVRSAMTVAHANGFASIAFPVIGAGTGGYAEAAALDLMRQALAPLHLPLSVRIVRFRPRAARRG